VGAPPPHTFLGQIFNEISEAMNNIGFATSAQKAA